MSLSGNKGDAEEEEQSQLMDSRFSPEMGSFTELFDANAEPAVAEVQQKILSEAKMKEAIRDAQEEILRQRLQQGIVHRKEQELENNFN